MYTSKQRQLVNDIIELIEIENITDDNTSIKIRIPDDFSLKFSKKSLDITFMFTVEDLHNILYISPIEDAIKNIAITAIYFYDEPYPSTMEDVLWNIYMDIINNS